MDEILTNDGLALAVTEYTGDIVAGEGLEFDQNVLNVVGKMDESKLAIEDNVIKSYDGKSFGGSSGSDETILFSAGTSSSAVLSENYDNFEKLAIYFSIETDTTPTYCSCPREVVFTTDDILRLNGYGIEFFGFRGDGAATPSDIVMRYSRWKFTNKTQLDKIYGYQSVNFGSRSSSQYACYIFKIIGINRKV